MASRAHVTPDLAAELDLADSANLLDVIVELDDDADDAGDIAAAKAAFNLAAEPVAAMIADLGGEVIEGAWINSTLKARLPASGIPVVANLDRVAAVDVPHAIHHD